MNILDPQGPIAAADKTILVDSVAIMLAIVLPTIVAIFGFAYWFRASNHKAHYRPDWEYSGRIELVVWSIPARRRCVDRRARARPGEADRRIVKAADDSGRLSRLEMAVHLSRPESCDHQYAHRSRGRAAAVPAYLGQRDERVLHSATRKPDLHHERHDHPAQSAGRHAGDASRPLGTFQRRRIFRHALRRACCAAGAVFQMGPGRIARQHRA
jgi:hypothetical protein